MFILLQVISQAFWRNAVKNQSWGCTKSVTHTKKFLDTQKGKTHTLFSPHMEACSSLFYIKLLKEAETQSLSLPAGHGQVSKCEKHIDLLQYKTKLWLSAVHHLQHYLTHSTRLYCWPPLCTAVLFWECPEFNCCFSLTLHLQTCCFKPLSWATIHSDLHLLHA